jgi:hypothetical protein
MSLSNSGAQETTVHTRSSPNEGLERTLANIEERLSQHISQELHHYAAHIDAHLAEHLARLVHDNIAHLAEHLSRLVHDNIAHVDVHLSQQISAEVHRHMTFVDAHLSEHLAREVSLQLGTGGPGGKNLGSAEIRDRIVSLARLLRPCSAEGISKVRVGCEADGGYVLLNDFSRITSALSFGVGQEMTWDLELADRGISVHQFDHTIDAPPARHDLITFHRRRIAPRKDEQSESLGSAIELTATRLCIVKMDIEGDEWDVLDAADSTGLKAAAQFVCEFHGFERIDEADWYAKALRVLRKIQDTFAVVHVHANNYGLLRARGNIAFPDILEVTFANREFYTLRPSDEIFPTELDAANRPDLPDIFLGAFRF